MPVLPRYYPRAMRWFPARAAHWRKIVRYGAMPTTAHGDITAVRLRLPAAHPAVRGLRIAFFSDTHAMADPLLERIFRQAAEVVAAFDPDYLLCGGDFSGYASQMKACWPMLANFAPCRAVKLAVEGNWETRKEWIPHAYWQEHLAEHGFRLLKHELFFDGRLALYGMGDYDYPVPPPRWPEEPCERIVLVHNPDVLIAAPETDRRPFLAFSGHTHGGQVRLPLVGPVAGASLYGRRFDAGIFRHRETGSQMLLSAGLNHLSFPLRLGCRREVILLTLV